MKMRRLVVALLSLAMLATACGDDDSGGGFSNATRNAYLQGCEVEGNEAFCECTIDEFEERFTEDEFIAFAIEASEEPPEEFVEVVLACLSEADFGE